jgi:hypothetical protein
LVSATTPKEAWRVRAGQIGARRRWGPPRSIKLADLTPDQRRAILSYLEVAKHEKAASDVETLAAGSGGHSSDQPAT